jgi:hypothetical protein
MKSVDGHSSADVMSDLMQQMSIDGICMEREAT